MGNFDSIRFQAGRPLTRELGAERMNAILTEIKRNKPKGERGITVRQDGTGTYIGLAAALPKGGGASTPATPQPWDLIARVDPDSDPEDPTYILRVRPGTLARVLADNWDEEFEDIASGTLYYGIAKVTTDGTFITGVTINISTEEPEEQEATEFGLPENVDILFGLFKDGQSYNVTGGRNIDVYGKNVIITTAENASVGDPVYTLWFKLQ